MTSPESETTTITIPNTIRPLLQRLGSRWSLNVDQMAFVLLRDALAVAEDGKLTGALNLISAERALQDVKWGQQNHNPMLWYAILGEEFGEVGKEICEHAAYAARLTEQASHDPEENRRIARAIRNSPHYPRLRDELVQLAAVAVAMLESLERNQGVTL